jgi:hypothetical protein
MAAVAKSRLVPVDTMTHSSLCWLEPSSTAGKGGLLEASQPDARELAGVGCRVFTSGFVVLLLCGVFRNTRAGRPLRFSIAFAAARGAAVVARFPARVHKRTRTKALAT